MKTNLTGGDSRVSSSLPKRGMEIFLVSFSRVTPISNAPYSSKPLLTPPPGIPIFPETAARASINLSAIWESLYLWRPQPVIMLAGPSEQRPASSIIMDSGTSVIDERRCRLNPSINSRYASKLSTCLFMNSVSWRPSSMMIFDSASARYWSVPGLI